MRWGDCQDIDDTDQEYYYSAAETGLLLICVVSTNLKCFNISCILVESEHQVFFFNHVNILNKMKTKKLFAVSLSKCIRLPGIFSFIFLVNMNTVFALWLLSYYNAF